MDAEDYIVTNWLDSTDYPDEHKRDIRATYDRVRRLFVNASVNHNLDNLFLTRDALNYCHAFGIPNTATIHSAGADYQTNNLWADVYNKTIQNAGLTDEERTFLRCLRYMLTVESTYSQLVDKLCYLLVRQANQSDVILGENGNCCKKVDTVDMISTRCPLATKLDFLTSKGFRDIAGACDRDLRNATAHMTAVIGKPTVKSERYDTGTTFGFKTNSSIEGADIRIRRRAKGGSYRWEKVDLGKAGHRLEMAVWRYMTVFSLCDTVHEFTTNPTFLCALDNPDDPRYRITFSKGRVSLNYNPSGEANQ